MTDQASSLYAWQQDFDSQNWFSRKPLDRKQARRLAARVARDYGVRPVPITMIDEHGELPATITDDVRSFIQEMGPFGSTSWLNREWSADGSEKLRIFLSTHAPYLGILLHELAHSLLPPDANHGPVFARLLLNLQREYSPGIVDADIHYAESMGTGYYKLGIADKNDPRVPKPLPKHLFNSFKHEALVSSLPQPKGLVRKLADSEAAVKLGFMFDCLGSLGVIAEAWSHRHAVCVAAQVIAHCFVPGIPIPQGFN